MLVLLPHQTEFSCSLPLSCQQLPWFCHPNHILSLPDEQKILLKNYVGNTKLLADNSNMRQKRRKKKIPTPKQQLSPSGGLSYHLCFLCILSIGLFVISQYDQWLPHLTRPLTTHLTCLVSLVCWTGATGKVGRRCKCCRKRQKEASLIL